MTNSNQRRHTFYVAMACLVALLALIGFSRRYILPLAAGTFDAPAIVRFHGIITFLWIALLVAQVMLAAKGRITAHRNFGMAGIALGTLVIYTAAQIAVLLLARELKDGGPSPREFSATLMSWVLLSATLFGFAIAKIDTPETHKRLILLTSFVFLNAALARIIQLFDGSLTRLIRNDLAGVACDALIAIAVAYDFKTRGRPHFAYVVGGIYIVAIQVATLYVRTTPTWHGAADWLARLAG